MDNRTISDQMLKNRALVRIYATGLLVVVALGVGWKVLQQMSPWNSLVDSQLAAALLTLGSILLMPFVFGCLVEFVLRPLTGKWSFWATIWNIENRIISEIQREDPKVVLINWPSESVRTLGVMTSVVQDTDTSLAAVYVPAGGQGKSGAIRVVPLSDVEVTGWRVRDLQVFQLTYGRLGPDALAEIFPDTAESAAGKSDSGASSV